MKYILQDLKYTFPRRANLRHSLCLSKQSPAFLLLSFQDFSLSIVFLKLTLYLCSIEAEQPSAFDKDILNFIEALCLSCG